MNRLYFILLAAFSFLLPVWVAAQDVQQGVTVHADPRLAVLLKKTHIMVPVDRPLMVAPQDKDIKQATAAASYVHKERRIVYNGKGYRVQIYNGPDRVKATQIKMEFMRHFPGIRTYLTYNAPSFRIKVGDYRNRSDAMGMMREASSMYSPCMIVPDMVTVSVN